MATGFKSHRYESSSQDHQRDRPSPITRGRQEIKAAGSSPGSAPPSRPARLHSPAPAGRGLPPFSEAGVRGPPQLASRSSPNLREAAILREVQPEVPAIPSRFLSPSAPQPAPSPRQMQPPVARRLNFAQSAGNLRRSAANDAATSGDEIPPLPSRPPPRPPVRFDIPARSRSDNALAVGPLVTGPRVTQGVSDPSIIRGQQDFRWWAGRITGINDRLLAAEDGLTVTDRHNHALHELRHKCMDNAARESLALFGRAWRDGWSVAGLEACQADQEALPVVGVRGKLKEAMGKFFGGRKPKQ
ncbi:MAG: hypothetical protein Q9183_003565 [Haloplaca sp. 2 TL-2023]